MPSDRAVFPRCPAGTPTLYGRPLSLPRYGVMDARRATEVPVGMPYLNNGDDPDPYGPDPASRETSGPGAHPVCGLYATRSCPHLMGREVWSTAGWVVMDGSGLVPVLDDHGRWPMETESLFDNGVGDVTPRSAPVTQVELRALARVYPHRAGTLD